MCGTSIRAIGEDCNNNGISDECDLDPNDPDGDGDVSVDDNNNGVPDECELDCNGNGISDGFDIVGGLSLDCNVNCVPDECEVGGDPGLDANGNGVLDECELSCCANGMPQILVMLYTRDGCIGSDNTQVGRVCTDFADPGPLPATVQILADNRSTPGNGQGTIWFQGTVSVDQTFILDAANSGETVLSGKTYIHIMDLDGTLLQTSEIRTSCSQPLFAGDQFGASLLVGCVGEFEEFADCNGNGVPDERR